jgi:hypothetical protein
MVVSLFASVCALIGLFSFPLKPYLQRPIKELRPETLVAIYDVTAESPRNLPALHHWLADSKLRNKGTAHIGAQCYTMT